MIVLLTAECSKRRCTATWTMRVRREQRWVYSMEDFKSIRDLHGYKPHDHS